MATVAEETVGYSLAKVGTVTLESTDESPWYSSIVVCQDKIVVIDYDEYKAQLFRLHDGQCLATTDRLESEPCDLCLMDAMTICVIHEDGLIKMVSIDCTDMSRVLKTTRELRLQGVMDDYRGVVRFKDNLVVCGVKQDMMCWCVVSLHDGHVDTIHQICKRDRGWWCRVTTKDNIVYVACDAGDKFPDNTGVYGFDILNLSECKYKYKHQRLQDPRSIVVNEDGNIFVCDGLHDSCIHQLTAFCQLVAIFTQEIPRIPFAMFWDNGRLYVTCYRSRDITVFTHLYQGNHEDSEVGTSIEIEQGNVDKVLSSVKTEMPPSVPDPENSEDEKQEVIMIDEKKPVIEEASTKTPKEIMFQRIVEEKVCQIGIRMPTEELGSFLSFQREIGTTLYFSKGPKTSIDGQDSFMATEMFLQTNHPDMMDKWLEYKHQGKLTPELIDVIYSRERRPELHCKKDMILKQMVQLNIIIKARSFCENGVKEENYFFTPCMLRLESPREVVAPEQDPRMLSTSVLCWVFTGTFLPTSIFDGLLAACLARWPVTKKRNTSKHLISYGCTVFDLDLTHRLTLNCKNNVVYARIIWLVTDDIRTPNAKLCTRVRKFIARKLSKITDSLNQNFLNQNLQYELCLQSQESQDVSEDSRIRFSPFEMWFEDEGHDPDSPIKPEHMNHARLCVALVTVCGKALREMLLGHFPVPYTDIYQALLANQAKLTGGQGRPLLNHDQIKLVFPDPQMQKTGTVEMFDLSLLYTLIRNVSTVQAPKTRWGIDPQPADNSLGASVERIRSYRNHISGHSPDAEISHQDFEDYWKKIEKVLRDIEVVINKNVYSTELERQKRQVISVFDAC